MAILRTIGTALVLAALWAAVPPAGLTADTTATDSVLVLCYHSVQVKARPNDPYTISQQLFVQQMEYLRAHDYRPISVEALKLAAAGRSNLPPRAVLLTFDDAYRSYYDFVVPLLAMYGYPSMLAVVGRWTDGASPDNPAEPLMTWDQIRQVAQSPLVTVASHSYDLHKEIRYTPQGNAGAAVSVRAYRPDAGAYETESAYRQRLQIDFDRQRDLLTRRLGQVPDVMVWPYGYYNAVSEAVAAENGYALGFCLDEGNLGLAPVNRPGRLNRVMVINEPMDLFIYSLKHLGERPPMRAAQVDLDLIVTPDDPAQTEQNLGRLIDRLTTMQINTVFLQAFADPDGDGNVRSVYFHNRVLPVQADIFAHAVHQLAIRRMRVYAWLPVLSYQFPDEAFNRRFRVQAIEGGQVVDSSSWYARLTPFSDDVARQVAMLYEDLADGAQISGILFQDDAYLTDFEDMHPLALTAFGRHLGRTITAADQQSDPSLADTWMRFKTDRLIAFTDTLATAVRKYRPDARFARNLYARPLITPHAEAWFAQNYDRFLGHYDHVVVMAYPQMEKAHDPLRWLAGLVRAADRPAMKAKAVFKLQAYDWQARQWVPNRLLLDEMRTLLAAGARHLAFYPDNVWQDRPEQQLVRQEMSTRAEPVRE